MPSVSPTTMSCLPSPVRSAVIADIELPPALREIGAEKVPSPLPSRTSTPPEVSATTRSSLPSPLTSAAVTE
jgi:hypothetical protein